MNKTIFRSLAVGMWFLVCAGCVTGQTSIQETEIFLVRHAEKQKGRDPSLTVAGGERAEMLAERLADEGITHIFSTDYNRTRETAAPVAERLGLPVQLYDPRDLPGFAVELKERSGRHLVVGHSNTTPALVAELGGDPGTPIEEATEYNRLYIVTLGEGGAVTTRLERYGPANPTANSE